MSNPTQCEARVHTPDGDRPCTVVSLRGDLDRSSGPALLDHLTATLPPPHHHLLVIDLAEVPFMDVGGLDTIERLDDMGYAVKVTGAHEMADLVLTYARPRVVVAPSADRPTTRRFGRTRVSRHRR